MNRSVRNNQLLQLIIAQFRETLREPAVLFWGIVFPILMSLGLGVAFTGKPDVMHHIAIVGHVPHKLDSLITMHGKPEMKDDGKIVMVTLSSPKVGNTIFHFHSMDDREALVQLKRGRINMIIGNSDGEIRYNFDPSNPESQLIYYKLSTVIANHDLLTTESLQSIEPLTVRGTRYIDFLVPGLIALGVISSSMWGISYSIIERRSKKLLRRMIATPMRKSNFLIAMITVRTVMNIFEAGLLVLFTWLVFGITIQGNIPALFTVFIAGNIAFAGIAVLVSSNTSKTEVGNGLINLVTMPMMVLSGIFFSYHNFPDWSISFIQKLPLTMMADGMRSIFNEGAGWAEISIPSAVMFLTGTLFFTAGVKIFKWH
jgi:ABC-type multidrug transport system permease subunit